MLQVSTKCKIEANCDIKTPIKKNPFKKTTSSAENINLNNNCDFLVCETVLHTKISISVTVYHFNKEWPIKFTTAFTIKNPRCISNYITSLF